jgi:exodeoxyribonuclease VII small subunit
MSNARGADKTAPDLQELPFEDALKRLETIVESMEAQDLPLETLLARYEEGARLTALCQGKLTEAELKIQQLEKNAKGGFSLKPLASPEEME